MQFGSFLARDSVFTHRCAMGNTFPCFRYLECNTVEIQQKWPNPLSIHLGWPWDIFLGDWAVTSPPLLDTQLSTQISCF